MARRFVTLYPIAKNTHLIKDVGQIPYFLHRQHGFHSQLVCYRNDDDYPYLASEAKGLELEFLEPRGKRMFLENAAIQFLQKNAEDIDVLNLYHLDRDTFYYGNLYKKLNPNGVLYCKLDLYNQFLEAGKKQHSINIFKNWVFRRWERQFVKNTDLFSVENREGLGLMKKHYPPCSEKSIYLPNGVNSPFVDQLFDTPMEKEKMILVMSRIGETIKNHEILLRVIPHLELGDWKIVFAGPVVQRFQPKIEAFYREFPQLRENVKFVGEVTDRKSVYDWFRRARVTCLTSRQESFGIAYAEALYFGNYLLGTDGMSSFSDITHGERFGKALPFNDDKALKTELQRVIDNSDELDGLRDAAMGFSRQNFVWPVLAARLNAELEKRLPNG